MEAAQLLIDEGADPNAKDRFGSTPLDDAMRGSHHDLVVYLKSKKAKHGGLDKLQAKLFEHCAKGDLSAVRMMLAKDVDGNPVPGSAAIAPNCCDYDKRTPLHLAVAEGHVELVALLLANGADPNALDRWGLTPLEEAERKAARVGVDPVRELFREGGFLPPEKDSIWSFFSIFFGFWEVAMMILIGLFCIYGEGGRGGEFEDRDRVARGLGFMTLDEFTTPSNEHQMAFSRVYPLFQDVHVMIFVGFGFLMVFLRKHGYTSVGLTFLIGAFVIQWYQLTLGFWANVFAGGEWVKQVINVETLCRGDFAAGAVLITFGVLLGKVNPQQILFVAIIETIFFALNEQIGLYLGAADIGGTMTIHMFGAFFGFGCTWMMTPKEAYGHENNAANYHSDTMAMVGTVFLWMFWPSFNGALSVANAQERCVVNTLMSLCGSCTVAFLASHVLRRERKFHMVDIQNATLAGGVAMGAAAEMIVGPGAAIGIGGAAGLVSVVGYVYIQPFLERRLGLHDTCGVNNLHGMPSLIGGFASVIAAGLAHTGNDPDRVGGYRGNEGYSFAQLAHTFPKRAGYDAAGHLNADGRSANTQAAIQFAYMMTSVWIGLISGAVAGSFAMTRLFTPSKAENMYVDSEHWEVPHLETPYYFDHRGEVSRGPDGKATYAEPVDTEGDAAVENSKVEGANLDAPDNARLLGLITALETRLNVLTRRLGMQNAVGSTPLSGPEAIPQTHMTKSAVPLGAEPEYPQSKLVVPVATPATTVAASPSAAGAELQQVQVQTDAE